MPLNMPVQGAIDRLRESYEPFLVELGEFEDDDGTVIVVKGRANDGDYGSLPSDPQAVQGHDARGWHCQPTTGCVWAGLV